MLQALLLSPLDRFGLFDLWSDCRCTLCLTMVIFFTCSVGIPSMFGVSEDASHRYILFSVTVLLALSGACQGLLRGSFSSNAAETPMSDGRPVRTSGSTMLVKQGAGETTPLRESMLKPTTEVAVEEEEGRVVHQESSLGETSFWELPSARRISVLAALFAVDAFAGAMVLQSFVVCELSFVCVSLSLSFCCSSLSLVALFLVTSLPAGDGSIPCHPRHLHHPFLCCRLDE
jgi:hypothetical protein